MFHEWWGVPVLLMGMGVIFVPCEDRILFYLVLFASLLNTWERPLQLSRYNCAVLFSLRLYFVKASYSGLPGLSTPSPQPVGQWSSAWIVPFCATARNFLKVVTWGNHKVYLLCFLSLMDHCPLLPNIQCLEIVVLCVLSFIVVWVSRVNLVSVHFGWKQKFSYAKFCICMYMCTFSGELLQLSPKFLKGM